MKRRVIKFLKPLVRAAIAVSPVFVFIAILNGLIATHVGIVISIARGESVPEYEHSTFWLSMGLLAGFLIRDELLRWFDRRIRKEGPSDA